MGGKSSKSKQQSTSNNKPDLSRSQTKQQSSKQNLQAETYYKNLSQGEQLNSDNSPKEQIQMQISIKNAEPGSLYSVQVFMTLDSSNTSQNNNNNNYKPLGGTQNYEPDENRMINFDLAFILDYFFEKQQLLNFTITKNNQNEQITTTLGNIMGSRGQTLAKDLKAGEKLIISATTLKNNNINVAFKVEAFDDMKNTSLFYVIKKAVKNLQQNNILDNNGQMKINLSQDVSQHTNIYKSEVKQYSPNENCFNFNGIKIPASIFCYGDFENQTIIEFYDYSRQQLVGQFVASVDKYASLNNTVVNLSTVNNLKMKVHCNYIKEYTFLDYLRGGLQLALSIGIDFTGSNGHPNDTISLHYIGGNTPNSYEKAIRSCGDIVAYYDYDQQFPVYGYGAILPGTNVVNQCFPLSLDFTNPNINTIDGVLSNYRTTVTKCNFSGPTLFAPLLNQIVTNIKSDNNKNVYHILLILTDGVINDMNETIDCLVEASMLPLSVIIVGIGRADFSNMNTLDADEAPLVDKRGRKSVRDLVQFVPFYKFENDGKRLAEEVLEEVPKQVVDYFKFINMPPGDPVINII